MVFRKIKPVAHAAHCGRGAGKRRYPTEYEADQAIERAEAQRPGEPLRSYWCGKCSGWHLTHQPQRR